MADQIITSFGVLNYSGMLFNKGNVRAPFSTLIANKAKSTNAVEFTTGLEYTTVGGEQPDISEKASLVAPDATLITREQQTNVTQIFQESVYISYGKQSNMGTMSGINIAGQVANPANELDFQVAAKMNKIARDIEYTFLNGVFNKSASDAVANTTRGMFPAITTNELEMVNKPLRVWDVAEAMKLIYEENAPTTGLVLWVDPVAMFQLNADAEQNGNTIVPASRNVNGLNISTLITPLGEIGVYLGEFLPAGTAGIFNVDSIGGRVEQPTPGKGNFFMEELSKIGAGTKYQIFGQLGLDHGPEWHHAKITGISTNFEKPKAGKKIYAVDAIPTVEILPELDTVVLGTPTVGAATDALTITYRGIPTDNPTLAYQWKIASSANGAYTNIASATSATYTPAETDVDKFIKCEVTASGTAIGKVLSNAKKVVAAPTDP